MTTKRWRVVALFAAVVALGLAGRLINYPALAGGFKGDEATYVSMAFSIADDFDLKYDRGDFERFGRLFGAGRSGRPVGPEGIFLKQGASPTTERLEYGKAFIYPLAAAPFARLGGLGGMLIFNVLLLAGCVWCAIRLCAARVGGWRGHALAVAFIAASSTPVWAAWLTSEMFNFALIFYAYFLWAYKEVRPDAPGRRTFLGGPWSDVLAAVLIGLATYSKVSNAALIGPLVVYALWRRGSASGRERLAQSVVIGVVFAASTAGLFAANKLISGEISYQGGNRKTFYGHFPFDDAGSRFDAARGSNEMVTEGVSSDILFPLRISGHGIERGSPRFWPLLGHNVWYFFSGRDSGLVPYFFPGALIVVLWLGRWRDMRLWQVLTFGAIAGTAVILLVWFPYTWNGAGGPPGNRYFFSVYPLFLFLVPAGTGAVAALSAWVIGGAFAGAIVLHPFLSSKAPWTVPERAPLRWLPIELTMMDDVPARLHPGRGRLPFGNPRNALLYYMDAGTYTPEDGPNGQFFWVAGATRADIVVRLSDRTPSAKMRLIAESRVANHVTIDWGGDRCVLALAPDQPATCELRASGGVWAHRGYFFPLSVTTTAGFVPSVADPRSADQRNLGVRLTPVFDDRDAR